MSKKSKALNAEPYAIAGKEYWIKPSYDGSGRMYAYVKGAGQQGKLALGVKHNPADPEGCLSACLMALRERFQVADTNFKARSFDTTSIQEPLSQRDVRLWQVIAFHRSYFDQHTPSRYTARHDIADDVLAQRYGKKYETMTLNEFNDTALSDLAKFMADKYRPRRRDKLSANVMWATIATLKAAVNFAQRPKPCMGLRNADGDEIGLVSSVPTYQYKQTDFRKATGQSPKAKSVVRENWSPQDVAILLNQLSKRCGSVRGPNSAEQLIRWVIVSISCPARVGELFKINWNMRQSPHFKRGLFVGSSDLVLDVPDSAYNKRGGMVRVCPTLAAYLKAWGDASPLPPSKAQKSDRGKYITMGLRRAADEAGLDLHLTARTFRYVMTGWLREHCSDAEVNAVFGWASANGMIDNYDEQMIRSTTGKQAQEATQKFWNEVAAELESMGALMKIAGVKKC